MDIIYLDIPILSAVRQQLGCDDVNDITRDVEISNMEPIEVFTLYLEWEGIIGYSDQLWRAVENIREAGGEM